MGELENAILSKINQSEKVKNYVISNRRDPKYKQFKEKDKQPS